MYICIYIYIHNYTLGGNSTVMPYTLPSLNSPVGPRANQDADDDGAHPLRHTGACAAAERPPIRARTLGPLLDVLPQRRPRGGHLGPGQRAGNKKDVERAQ